MLLESTTTEWIWKALLATGLLGLVSEGAKWVIHRLWTRRSRRTRRETISRAEVQLELQRVLNKTPAYRVSVLKSHNGGGDPRLDREVFSTALDEAGPTANWVKQSLDGLYKIRLASIIEHGSLSLDIATMDPSILKTKYEAEGIKRAEFHMLALKQEGVLYLSVEYQHEEPVSAMEKEVVRVAVSRLMVRYREPTDVKIGDDGRRAESWRPMFFKRKD